MSKEGIDFSRLEPDEPFDESRIADEDSQADYDAFRTVRRMAAEAPEIEPPPFFAARVARLALDVRSQPLVFFFHRAARQLLPAFLAVLVTIGFLAYRASPFSNGSDWEEDPYLAYLMAEEEPTPHLVTLDDLFSDWADSAEAGASDESR